MSHLKCQSLHFFTKPQQAHSTQSKHANYAGHSSSTVLAVSRGWQCYLKPVLRRATPPTAVLIKLCFSRQSVMSFSEDDEVESVEEELDQSDNRVQVCLRLRPMNKFETSRRSKNCVELHDDRVISVDSPLEGEYDFTLDRVSPIVMVSVPICLPAFCCSSILGQTAVATLLLTSFFSLLLSRCSMSILPKPRYLNKRFLRWSTVCSKDSTLQYWPTAKVARENPIR